MDITWKLESAAITTYVHNIPFQQQTDSQFSGKKVY